VVALLRILPVRWRARAC